MTFINTQGTILLDNTGLSPSVNTYSRPDIISRCTDQYSGAEFYQQVQERGLFLGERVQWIEQIWSRKGEALARLRLPRSLKISQEYEMGFHPGVFEASAQLFHAALSRSKDTDMRYMVTRWEDFACTKPPSLDQVFWCHVVLQDGPPIGNQLQGRFSLFDENGTLVAQIRSGVMRGLNKEREGILRNYLVQSETTKERKSDSPIIRALSSLSQDQWRDCLNDYLQQVFASILHVEVRDLNKDDALLDMGMDSIVGMEAKTKLEEELGIALPIELLIIGPSISELTESILPLLEINPSQIEHETSEAPLPTYKTDIDSWIVHRKSNP